MLKFSAVVTKEEHLYVAHCPELDVASQGTTVEEALTNLREAVELYLEDPDAKRPTGDQSPLITFIEVTDNGAPSPIRTQGS
jgi:predicted RNase H-like HicB family nuclease